MRACFIKKPLEKTKGDGMKVEQEVMKSFVKLEWSKEDYHILWEHFKEYAKEDYGNFSAKLLPGTSRNRILGIRLPLLRKFAKAIAKGNLLSYLEVVHDLAKESDRMLEEKLVWAFLIGHIKDWEESRRQIQRFVPYIDNWSVNDSFCSSLKIAKNHPMQMLELVQDYLDSKQMYELRFSFVMLLNYYIKEDTIDFVLEACNRDDLCEYYVQMAVAWTVSMCYVFDREKTLTFFENCKLDDFTFNKSVQKILESLQITKEEKQIIKSLKRR